MKPPTSLRIAMSYNGQPVLIDAEPRTTLADALRRDCGASEIHLGCEHGVCGACSVHVDGVEVRSCLMLAVQADRAAVVTATGLTGSIAEELRTAFAAHHALQCGFCTAGMLVTSATLIDSATAPLDETEVRHALCGNICRCTGYQGIIDAILKVDAARRADEGGDCDDR
ncbi:MAG: (2Fe-2S)-binding protein [Acidimicrobiia bacterium]